MTIVVARSPRDLDRDRRPLVRSPRFQNIAPAAAPFLRGWWHGARGEDYRLPFYGAYADGYTAGQAWRAFHGPDRAPNATHARDALTWRKFPDDTTHL